MTEQVCIERQFCLHAPTLWRSGNLALCAAEVSTLWAVPLTRATRLWLNATNYPRPGAIEFRFLLVDGQLTYRYVGKDGELSCRWPMYAYWDHYFHVHMDGIPCWWVYAYYQ